MTPWGQCRQPASVQSWRNPVTIKDLDNGASVPLHIDAALLDSHRLFLEYGYPVPFSSTFGDKALCIEVGQALPPGHLTGPCLGLRVISGLPLFPLFMARLHGATG